MSPLRNTLHPARSRAGRLVLAAATVAGLTAGMLAVPTAAVADPPQQSTVAISMQRHAPLTQVLDRYNVNTSDPNAKGPDEAFSAPAVGDVTGDGQPDIVTGAMNGRVYIYKTDGTQVRTAIDPNAGAIQASPTLYDLNGDGVLDIVITTASGLVLGFSVRGGGYQELFRAHDQCVAGRNFCGMVSSAAIGDIDGDGQPEIVVGSFAQGVYAWKLNGQLVPGWPYYTADTVWSTPALADITGDGVKDVIVGGDSDGVPGQPYPRGGVVFAIQGSGARLIWAHTYSGQVIWSSPAVGDLNGDGRLDIVVGTGSNFPNAGYQVIGLDSAGNNLPGWPVNVGGRVVGSPALADLNGDGKLEAVVLAENAGVYAVKGDGSFQWVSCTASFGACDGTKSTHGQVAIADINNDGIPDVVVQSEYTMNVLNGRDGKWEFQDDARAATKQYISNLGNVIAPAAAPTIAQIGSQVWVMQHQIADTNNDNQRDVGDTDVTAIWTFNGTMGNQPWPTFHGSYLRDGRPTLTAAQIAQIKSYVQRVYQDVLGRAADQAGLNYWTNLIVNGQSRNAIAVAFASTDESRAVLINQVYRTFQGRQADSAGLQYWLGRFRAGLTVEDLKTGVIGSDEFYARNDNDPGTFVDAVYEGLLNRAPDAGGRQYWINQINSGVPRGTVSNALVRSTEALSIVVNDFYRKFLDRDGDSSGVAYYAGLIQKGTVRDEDVIGLIVGSQEYFNLG